MDDENHAPEGDEIALPGETPRGLAEVRIRRRFRDPITLRVDASPVPEAMMPPPMDALDQEIDDAIREGRAVDPSRAFPDDDEDDGDAVQRVATSAQPHELPRTPASPPEPPRGGRALQLDPNERPPAPQRDAYSHLSPNIPDPLPENPAERASRLTGLGDIEGRDEFQMRMMHRMLQRQLPMASIAHAMGVSLRTAYRIKDKLYERYRREGESINVTDLAGRALWTYEELKSTTLRWASDTSIPLRDRMKAVQLADQIGNSQLRFLHVSRFFESNPLHPAAPKEINAADKVDNTLKAFTDVMRLAFDDTVEWGDDEPKGPVTRPDQADDDLAAALARDGSS